MTAPENYSTSAIWMRQRGNAVKCCSKHRKTSILHPFTRVKISSGRPSHILSVLLCKAPSSLNKTVRRKELSSLWQELLSLRVLPQVSLDAVQRAITVLAGNISHHPLSLARLREKILQENI